MTALLLAALLVPDPTPEATVRALVAAFEAHDPAGIARRVVGGKPFDLRIAVLPKWTLTVGEAKIDGDEATVETDSDIPDLKPNSPLHETVHLRRIDGDWRIVPANPSEDPRTVRPVAQVAMVSINPSLAGPRPASKQTQDLLNVKLVALATLMYAGDHKDRLPLAKGFQAAIQPYIGKFDCLTAPDAPKGTMSYFLDPRLSGALLTSLPNPAGTAMVVEGTPQKTAFPWRGRTPVGFTDGHAKLIDGPTLLAARKTPIR